MAIRMADLCGCSDIRKEFVICVALFCTGVILALLVAPLWFDPGDDGLYMYQANLVMRGGVAYRDFLIHDAPVGTLWHALLLSLFGNDALTLRLAIVPFKALLLPAIYLLARPLVPRLPAAAAGLAALVLQTWHSYMPPHVVINALSLAVASVLVLAVWLQRQRIGWLILAGALIGLTASFKQNMGLYLLTGSCLWLLGSGLGGVSPSPGSSAAQLAGPPRRDSWSYALKVVAWGVALSAVIWLLHYHPGPDVLFSLVAPILALGAWALLRPASRLRREGDSWTGVVQRLAGLTTGFGLTTLPWLLWYAWEIGPSDLFEGLIVRPSRLAVTWFLPLRQPAPEFWWFVAIYAGSVSFAAALLALSRRFPLLGRKAIVTWVGLAAVLVLAIFGTPLVTISQTGLIYTWLYFNILTFWPALVLTLRMRPRKLQAYTGLLLISASFLALQMYPQLRRINAGWCFQLYLPLAAWVLWSVARKLRELAPSEVRARIGAAPSVALCIVPVLAAWWVVQWPVSQYIDLPATVREQRVVVANGLVPLDIPHFHLRDTAEHKRLYEEAVGAIMAHTRPGEPIYCPCRLVAFYVAADRPAGVTDVYVTPSSPVAEGLVLRDELVRSNTQVILADEWVFHPNAPCDVIGPDQHGTWAVPIRDFITSEFRRVEVLGTWSVWQKDR